MFCNVLVLRDGGGRWGEVRDEAEDDGIIILLSVMLYVCLWWYVSLMMSIWDQ